MADTRRKDVTWTVESTQSVSWDSAQLAVLMDLRDELKRLNALLCCPNFTAIPSVLRSIRRNTAKPKKPRLRRVS